MIVAPFIFILTLLASCGEEAPGAPRVDARALVAQCIASGGVPSFTVYPNQEMEFFGCTKVKP